MASLLTIQAPYLSFITFMDKNQSHQQNSKTSSMLHSKDTKTLRIKTKLKYWKNNVILNLYIGSYLFYLLSGSRLVVMLLDCLFYMPCPCVDVHWLPLYPLLIPGLTNLSGSSGYGKAPYSECILFTVYIR